MEQEMKNSIDFEALYKTEFLNNSGENKSILGLRFDPVPFVLIFYVLLTIGSLFVGIIGSIILPDELYEPIHDFIDYYILGYDSVLFVLFIVFLPFAWIISYFTTDHNYEKYVLKDETLSPIIKAINPTFKYKYENYIPEKIFKASKISNKWILSYAGNDLAMGKIEDNYIMFSDLLVKGFAQTVFHGQFIVTEFNKNFEGTTVVLTDHAEVIFGKTLGGFIQSTFSGSDLVRMDNPDFEEAFVVQSSDSIEAHYLLTSTLMERILRYKEKTKQNIELSFFSNVICIAIPYDKDHFEYLDSSMFKSETQLKEAFEKEFTAPLELVTDIVEELKLNEKLWSKR